MRTKTPLLLSLPLLLGCSTDNVVGSASIASIELHAWPDTLRSLGETLQVWATVVASNGDTLSDARLAWRSSDPAVVTVDGSTGMVRAVRDGDAIITASDPSTPQIAASTRIAVRQRAVYVVFELASIEALEPVSPPLEVIIADEHFSPVESASMDVQLSAGEPWDTAARLTGTLVRRASAGVARFDDIAIDRPATTTALFARAEGVMYSAVRSFPVTASFVTLTAGGSQSCATTRTHRAFCWGLTPTDGIRTSPAPLRTDVRFAMLSASMAFACGLSIDGVAYCWGTSVNGQIGDGQFEQRDTPTPVLGDLRFAQIDLGPGHACAIATSKRAYCWGYNGGGQLGDGTYQVRTSPTPVSGDLTFESVSGGDSHTCALTSGGAAYCWGFNGRGQLGWSKSEASQTPVAVAGGISFRQLSAGASHTCGLATSGVAYCWGANDSAQLGDGTLIDRLAPVAVAGDLRFTAIAAGDQHTCAIAVTGIVHCWGTGTAGRMGNGVNALRTTPGAVSGGMIFASLSTGRSHTCAMGADGVYCWGVWGIGDGHNRVAHVPTRVIQ